MKNLEEQITRVQNVLRQLLCELSDQFFRIHKVDENNFSKIGYFPAEKNIWLNFLV